MTERAIRQQALEDLLAERVLVLDGAMGTMLQECRLTAEDFGGASLEGCNENLVRTRPDVVLKIHRAYLEAGADIIETNSFGGTKLVLAEYGLDGDAHGVNLQAARLARQAADEFSSSVKPRFVAGAMGPTTKAISVTGGVTFPELVDNFYQQAQALLEGGADLLLLETSQDTRTVKAALNGYATSWVSASPLWSPAPLRPWAPCWPGRPPTRFALPSPMRTCSPSASTVPRARNS